MKVYYDKDANLDVLKGKKVAIIGYGSQGHAHANNLKESGVDVVVAGLPKGGDSWGKAEKAGFKVDDDRRGRQGRRYHHDPGSRTNFRPICIGREIEPNMKKGSYSRPSATASTSTSARSFRADDVNVFMVAPKGPGHMVRHEYTKGAGCPA